MININPTLFNDLEIADFLKQYFNDSEKYLIDDVSVIKERNDICKELLNNRDLADILLRLFDVSIPITDISSISEGEPIQIIRRMNCVKKFFDTATEFIKFIGSTKNLPPFFMKISHLLQVQIEKNYPKDFDNLWATYASGADISRSISYRINFSKDIGIKSIAMTAVNNKRYTERSLINRFVGKHRDMQVHSLLTIVPGFAAEKEGFLSKYVETNVIHRFSDSVISMFREQTSAVKSQLTAMERSLEIREITEELRFVVGLYNCAQAMTSHMCFAEIRDKNGRILSAEKMIHPAFAGDGTTNDIQIKNDCDFILLGGVNRGGKTTFLRTAGVIQVFFQLGLPVPAKKATISPVSSIFSVFSSEESTELFQGKLGRELTDLRDVFSQMDEHSFFLGNEPICGTSPTESYLLSREALCILKARNVRGLWVTHLFKLFDDIDELNAIDFGSHFECMRTSEDFKIESGKPEKYSAGREVFQKNGH